MQGIGLINSSPENNYLKAYFSQNTECLIPDLCPELHSGCVEGQRLQWLVSSFFFFFFKEQVIYKLAFLKFFFNFYLF